MNLIDLKKQQKNQDSNYFFKRDTLIKNYVLSILKLYEYREVLSEYNPLNNDKIIKVNFDHINFISDHIDLAHAKHQALAILDYFETKFKKDFSVSTVNGVQDGTLIMYVSDSNIYNELISIKFSKIKTRVLLKGQINLSKSIQGMLEETSFFNIFKPYLVSLYPIQLNDKEVLKYGSRIAKQLKQSFIHDTSEIAHSEKTKLSSQLKVPYSVTYGSKDLEGLTVNVYHHQSQSYSRVKLSNLDNVFSEINKIKLAKDSSRIVYLCNTNKCRSSISKIEGILISPFNQIIEGKTCYICSKLAYSKFINIKVGERRWDQDLGTK